MIPHILKETMTYVYANVAGRVHNSKVVFELSRDDLASSSVVMTWH
jgi:hypothetical protein